MQFSRSILSTFFFAFVLLSAPVFGAPRHGGDDDGNRGGDRGGDRDGDRVSLFTSTFDGLRWNYLRL
jgi:hypothetical protein